MVRTTKTIDLKGKQYSEVKTRIKEFRTDNPRGLIETVPTIQPDGQILFRTRILKDKGDETSAEATGHALGANKGEKAFEKLETISVGRALALLGYSADGEIASSEEMEEFEDWQEDKFREAVLASRERIEDCKNEDELKEVWADLPVEVKKELNSFKDELKAKFVKKVSVKKPVVKQNPVSEKVGESVAE